MDSRDFMKQLWRYKRGSISRRQFMGATGLGLATGVLAGAMPELLAPHARAVGRRALIGFTLDRGGNIVAMGVRASSGIPSLDMAALAAVQRSAPFPPIPAGLPYPVMDIDLPVDPSRPEQD